MRTHCVMVKHRKQRFSVLVQTETRQPIDTKFDTIDYVTEITGRAKVNQDHVRGHASTHTNAYAKLPVTVTITSNVKKQFSTTA